MFEIRKHFTIKERHRKQNKSSSNVLKITR